MATIPVVALGGGKAVLSLVTDDATRAVTGYVVDRAADIGPVEVNLSAGAYSLRQTVGVGRTSASIAKNRQWNIDGDTDATYGLTSR